MKIASRDAELEPLRSPWNFLLPVKLHLPIYAITHSPSLPHRGVGVVLFTPVCNISTPRLRSDDSRNNFLATQLLPVIRPLPFRLEAFAVTPSEHLTASVRTVPFNSLSLSRGLSSIA